MNASDCDSDSGLMPNKRQRTLSPKGKEKMEETANGEEAICGICLLKGGLKIRGMIDSCDHYFCFICIMEWAKVESRCPMCKQRFRFIRRPEVPGLFASESVLEIPVRDQVYHPLGNESSALSDPYAQVNCTVCHGTDDDELLLLCDLCDSASHTYCVGLGHTVPDDNWYCHDCIILREENAKVDENADNGEQDRGTRVLDQQQPVSIFEIVASRRSFPTELLSPQQFHEISLSRSSAIQRRTSESIMANVDEPESLSSPAPCTDVRCQLIGVGQQARTLRHSRNIESRIQALRKNWNALRSGDLIFSSILETNNGSEQGTSRTNSELSPQTRPSTSVNNEQQTDSNISKKLSYSQDINRAWKMMQKAKSQRLSTANSSLDFVSMNKMAADKGVGCSTSGTYKQFPVQRHGKQFQSLNQPQPSNRLTAKTYNSKHFSSSKKNRDLTKGFTGSVKEVLPVCSSSRFSETTCSSLSSSECDAGGRTSGVHGTKVLSQDKKSCLRECIDRSSSKRNEIMDDNAKLEIQSMVKLNLRLLSKGRSLGSERFKEIARASTHSILAACGFEHSKSWARHFSNRVCRHAGPMKQHCASTFMPDSCSDCFDSFVKDVVNSILLETSISSNFR